MVQKAFRGEPCPVESLKVESAKASSQSGPRSKRLWTFLYRGLEDELRPLLTSDELGISQAEVMGLIR
jgi:hypothetical protein